VSAAAVAAACRLPGRLSKGNSFAYTRVQRPAVKRSSGRTNTVAEHGTKMNGGGPSCQKGEFDGFVKTPLYALRFIPWSLRFNVSNHRDT
jgi:hypothetical protein